MGFPSAPDGKESACNAGNLGLIPGWEEPLEKGMAPHSSILAWKIPWTEEPGRLPSMGSQRVNWVANTVLFVIVCASYSPTPSCPSLFPSPHLNYTCSLYLWVCFSFLIFTSLWYFSDSAYRWYYTVFVFGNFCFFFFEGTVSWPAVVPAFVNISPVTSSQLYPSLLWFPVDWRHRQSGGFFY